MGMISDCFASSHASAFLEPTEWEAFRKRIAGVYERVHGIAAPVQPQVALEDPDDNADRYATIRSAFASIRRSLAEDAPDAIVIIGNDQNENFDERYLIPQIAVYSGSDFVLKGSAVRDATQRFRGHPDIAESILRRGAREGFDIARVPSFHDGALLSHAHYQIVEDVLGDLDIPVVLLFVNALYVPTLTPARCYELGELLARVIREDRPATERVAIYASGGLSHFTVLFPWASYDGPHTFGAISEQFDRDCMELIEKGSGSKLADLSFADLLHHGDVEMCSWIALLGAIGDIPTETAVYEPFYRAMQGVAVCSWSRELVK